MGGKRPDQYQIDPSEATRTDHKWSEDADKVTLHTDEAAKSRAEVKEGSQFIPPKSLNPAVERLRAKALERQEHIHEEAEETEEE